MSKKPLLAVPNISEGRDPTAIEAVAEAFTAEGAARLIDVHSDVDHHRSVFTLAGSQGKLSDALLAGAKAAVERIDVREGRNSVDIGEHPYVGAVDVLPIVYLDPGQRGAACAEALVAAHEIGEGLGVPMLLYGQLARGRTRADLRRGGVAALGRRLSTGELVPDFGAKRLHPTAGAMLVAAREPLVAFNLELAPSASVEDAKRIASMIREGGSEGLLGVRAIGVRLRRDARSGRPESERAEESSDSLHGCARGTPSIDAVAQVSMNVERPLELPLRVVVEAVRKHAEVARAELVGLAPRAAFEGFPSDVPLPGFDCAVHVIENALGF